MEQIDEDHHANARPRASATSLARCPWKTAYELQARVADASCRLAKNAKGSRRVESRGGRGGLDRAPPLLEPTAALPTAAPRRVYSSEAIIKSSNSLFATEKCLAPSLPLSHVFVSFRATSVYLRGNGR